MLNSLVCFLVENHYSYPTAVSYYVNIDNIFIIHSTPYFHIIIRAIYGCSISRSNIIDKHLVIHLQLYPLPIEIHSLTINNSIWLIDIGRHILRPYIINC